MTWRLLSTPPLDGASNMAVDVWLMTRARTSGETVLRTYTWDRPTVSLGRHQRAAGVYDRAKIATLGFDVVRRPTGGRAILHWRELTYSVTAPTAGLGSAGEEYDRINALLLQALCALGVQAEVMTGGNAPHPGADPCFAEPGRGEIGTRDGTRVRKLVGSAQYREDGSLLQHGSILLHDDQPRLLALTSEDVAPTHATALSDLLEREVSPAEVESALFAAASAASSVEHLEFDGIRAAALAGAAAFRDSLWTWRR